MQGFSSDSSRWRAVQTRDKSAHSAFVYAVLTTKIVCRPTCPSRLARRSNVKYYDTVSEAFLDGFRSCKRCQPELPPELDHDLATATVANACKLIETTNGHIKLIDVAAATGFTIRHLHNLFKARLGCTPAAYAAKMRQITENHEFTSTPSLSVSSMSPVITGLLHYCNHESQTNSENKQSADPQVLLRYDYDVGLNDSSGDPQVPPDGDTDIRLYSFTDSSFTPFCGFEDFEIQEYVKTVSSETWLRTACCERLVA